MNIAFTVIMVFCATAHLTATTVVAVLATRRVQYLSLAVILGILTICLTVCAVLFYTFETTIDVGIIHPSIVMPLAASAFLETMYPLSFVLPGYLQLDRMVKYAMPVICVEVVYFISFLISGHAPAIHSFAEIWTSPMLAFDAFLRVAAVFMSIYYIIGLIYLPRILLKSETEIPVYLKGYCTWLGITYALFIALSFHFVWWLLYLVVIMVTVINMMFMLHSLEQIAQSLPRPAHESVPEQPEDLAPVQEESSYDFNEENLARFRKVERYMQSTEEWTESTFTRDRLCERTGINRHLLLQTLRSRGYNNIHEYITTYRVEYLRNLMTTCPDESLTSLCQRSGFSTLVTARNAYRNIFNRDLDQDFPPQSK